MTKQLLGFGIAVMTTLLALLVLWQFHIVVIYVLISLLIAAAMRPLVSRLGAPGNLRRVAWILLYLGALTGFGFVLILAVQTAIHEIQQVVHSVAAQDAWTLPPWLETSSAPLRRLVARLPPPSQLFEAMTGDQGQLVLPVIFGFTKGIGGAVSNTLIIVLLSIYWSLNQIHFERLWLSLLPSGQRKQARGIWRTIELDLGAYLRSEVVQSLLAGLLLVVGYRLLGSPYSTVLALVGALAWLIPLVGAPLAVILPLLLGLLTGVQLSLLTTLYTLVVLTVLQVWVEPRLFRRKWDNPMLTLVILLALADAFGLLGILVAPPISAVCQILWSHLVSQRAVAGGATQVSGLKERQALVWAAIETMEEPHLPLVTSSMTRLTQLIEKAEPLLQTLAPEPSEP